MNHDYKLSNSYVFDWESDFFSVSKTGYCYEVEIKISRSDFIADFKKLNKHALFKDRKKGIIIIRGDESRVSIGRDQNNNWIYATATRIDYREPIKCIPNRFYYACPEGLLNIEDIPDYAGLIYVREPYCCDIIKEAPLLHKEKHDLTRKLLGKFYYMSLDLERSVDSKDRYIKRLSLELENYKSNRLT